MEQRDLPGDPAAEARDISRPNILDRGDLKRHVRDYCLLRAAISFRQAKQQDTVDDRKLEAATAKQPPFYAIGRFSFLDLIRYVEVSEAVRPFHPFDQFTSHSAPAIFHPSAEVQLPPPPSSPTARGPT